MNLITNPQQSKNNLLNLFWFSRVYYAPIIGARGQTKKRLEEETKTIIKVPRQPQDHEVCKYEDKNLFRSVTA